MGNATGDHCLIHGEQLTAKCSFHHSIDDGEVARPEAAGKVAICSRTREIKVAPLIDLIRVE